MTDNKHDTSAIRANLHCRLELRDFEEFGRQIEHRLRYNEWGFKGSYPEIIDQIIAMVHTLQSRLVAADAEMPHEH